jgi:segregation and condensation protein B
MNELERALADLNAYGQGVTPEQLEKAVKNAMKGMKKADDDEPPEDEDMDEEETGEEEGDEEDEDQPVAKSRAKKSTRARKGQDDNDDDDYGDDDDGDEEDEDQPVAKGRKQKGRRAPKMTKADEDYGDDEDFEDDDDEENDDEDEEPPAQQTKSKKSWGAYDDAGDQFLKSWLLDDDGDPTPEADVVEVSDVLLTMSDAFAKSLSGLQKQLGPAQETASLVKSLAQAQIAVAKELRAIRKRLDQLDEQPAGSPYPGMMFSKSLPNGSNGRRLTKSQWSSALVMAASAGHIDRDRYTFLAGSLDTLGPTGIDPLLDDQERQLIHGYAAGGVN